MTYENEGPPEPTDRELLEKHINELVEGQEKAFNIWTQYAIENLREELARGYAEDGSAIPIQPRNDELLVQFSPPEAVNAPADEYWTVYPRGMVETPPKWISESGADPAAGLELTVRRSNGCFGIRNQIETSERWINDAAAVAEEYGCSSRAIRVAGYKMQGALFMLPTDDTIRNPYGRYGYALQPDIPFNDEEKRVWREMFVRYHFNLMMANTWLAHPLELNPSRLNASERGRIDPNGRHGCVTVPNTPQLIVPALMAFFNTAAFKERFYSTALIICREVDAGRTGRVPGYVTVEQMGGDFSNPFEWYAENESTSAHDIPAFRPGSDR